MIAIKLKKMKVLPSSCNNCEMFECAWWPDIGWVDVCRYAEDRLEDWICDGSTRPDACPLIEISEEDLIEIPEKDEVL